MIWLIIVVIFLGAVVAVMFVFVFLLDRERILAEQRTEARIPTRVGLELSGPDEPLIYEITFTENVSRHGARVVTKRRWSPNDTVLVKLPQSLSCRARISYCQHLKGDEFAMGLQFSFVVCDPPSYFTSDRKSS
jgi:PilZ domain-containing protein